MNTNSGNTTSPSVSLPFGAELLSSQQQKTSHSQSQTLCSNPFFPPSLTSLRADSRPMILDQHGNSINTNNPFFWPNGGDNYPSSSSYPNTVQHQQQTTNTSNQQDLLRLLLLSSSNPNHSIGGIPPQLMMPPPPPADQFPPLNSTHNQNSVALNSWILQSLGLAPPPPPPPPPPPQQQIDPNLLTMLLGHIAMNNPAMLVTLNMAAAATTTTDCSSPSFASPDNASHPLKNLLRSDGCGVAAMGDDHRHSNNNNHEKEAYDDSSSSDTCELANIDPVPMTTDLDTDHVSKYQCLVRKQIQFFEANDDDVRSTAQGRNKPIVLGQVGIQCRHCAKSSPKLRARGAVYFPSKWTGIYQAAQNMASAHFTFCSDTPDSIKVQLTKLKEGKSIAGGGKKFWGDSAAELGVVEDRHGLRFKKSL